MTEISRVNTPQSPPGPPKDKLAPMSSPVSAGGRRKSSAKFASIQSAFESNLSDHKGAPWEVTDSPKSSPHKWKHGQEAPYSTGSLRKIQVGAGSESMKVSAPPLAEKGDTLLEGESKHADERDDSQVTKTKVWEPRKTYAGGNGTVPFGPGSLRKIKVDGRSSTNNNIQPPPEETKSSTEDDESKVSDEKVTPVGFLTPEVKKKKVWQPPRKSASAASAAAAPETPPWAKGKVKLKKTPKTKTPASSDEAVDGKDTEKSVTHDEDTSEAKTNKFQVKLKKVTREPEAPKREKADVDDGEVGSVEKQPGSPRNKSSENTEVDVSDIPLPRRHEPRFSTGTMHQRKFFRPGTRTAIQPPIWKLRKMMATLDDDSDDSDESDSDSDHDETQISQKDDKDSLEKPSDQEDSEQVESDKVNIAYKRSSTGVQKKKPKYVPVMSQPAEQSAPWTNIKLKKVSDAKKGGTSQEVSEDSADLQLETKGATKVSEEEDVLPDLSEKQPSRLKGEQRPTEDREDQEDDVVPSSSKPESEVILHAKVTAKEDGEEMLEKSDDIAATGPEIISPSVEVEEKESKAKKKKSKKKKKEKDEKKNKDEKKKSKKKKKKSEAKGEEGELTQEETEKILQAQKEEREKKVVEEMNALIKLVEDNEIEDDMDEEIADVLRQAAIRSTAYSKQWYDVFTDTIMYLPSLPSVIMDRTLLDIADEIYGEDLPLFEAGSLRAVAAEKLNEEEEVPEYIQKLSMAL